MELVTALYELYFLVIDVLFHHFKTYLACLLFLFDPCVLCLCNCFGFCLSCLNLQQSKVVLVDQGVKVRLLN